MAARKSSEFIISSNQSSVKRKALAAAISTALMVPSHTILAQNSDTVLEEISVTATRRGAESVQDLAFSIKAFGQEELEQKGLVSLEDYARFVPTLSYFSQSPGAAKIVFRGVSDTPNAFIAQSSASLYLDDQPLTQNFNVDVRMVDIERLEALSGPQGTLYGDSSQSGLLRIITNKPDPSAYSARVNAEFRSGSNADASHDISGVVNIPLANNRAAIRIVGFTAEDGGFIDNVLSSTPRFGQKTNADIVENNWNDFSVSGARVAGKWDINDRWSALLQGTYQDSQADGLDERDPTLGDLAVARFNAEPRSDEWMQFGLTLEGKVGEMDLISTTAYFNRDVTYSNDRTTYASYFSQFCNGPYDPTLNIQYAPAYCFGGPTVDTNDPTHRSDYVQDNKRFTQELRLSGGGSRWDWLAGAFYEKKSEAWDYQTVAAGNDYTATPAFAYWSGLYDVDPNAQAWWNSNDDTEWTQYALFGEVNLNFDEKWTLTAGGRYYNTEFTKEYFVARPIGRLDAASNPNGNPPGFSSPTGDDSGFLPKVSLKYNYGEDKMVYGLYSEGFRAGGTNRGRGDASRVVVPFTYESDVVKNYELGFRTRLLGGRTELNATLFHMVWEDAQFEFNDPSFNFSPSEPFQTVVGNAFDAVNQGLEVTLSSLIGDNLEFDVSVAFLNAETDSSGNVCATAAQALQAECLATFVPIPSGARLPLTPEFKGSASLKYNFKVGQRDAYVQGLFSYSGDTVNQLQAATLADSPAPQLPAPSFSILDLSAGISGDNWDATLFITNATDERAIFLANSGYFDYFFGNGRESVNRPREIGLRFSYKWE